MKPLFHSENQLRTGRRLNDVFASKSLLERLTIVVLFSVSKGRTRFHPRETIYNLPVSSPFVRPSESGLWWTFQCPRNRVLSYPKGILQLFYKSTKSLSIRYRTEASTLLITTAINCYVKSVQSVFAFVELALHPLLNHRGTRTSKLPNWIGTMEPRCAQGSTNGNCNARIIVASYLVKNFVPLFKWTVCFFGRAFSYRIRSVRLKMDLNAGIFAGVRIVRVAGF